MRVTVYIDGRLVLEGDAEVNDEFEGQTELIVNDEFDNEQFIVQVPTGQMPS